MDFYQPISVTAASLALTKKAHGGVPVVANRAAGIAFTLPAAEGKGTEFEVIVGTAVTSNSITIKVASASDIMQGTAFGDDGDGEPANGWATASDSDTITLDGSTQGGLKGDRWMLKDIAAGVWAVSGFLQQGGTEATPFSATVS
jgi:hypothetical protein